LSEKNQKLLKFWEKLKVFYFTFKYVTNLNSFRTVSHFLTYQNLLGK